MTENIWMRRAQAAAYLAERGFPVAYHTLANLAAAGQGPRFSRFCGRIPMYARGDLDLWVESRLVPVRPSAGTAA